MELLAIVTAVALLEYMYISFQVGAARGKYGVEAPATTGHESFERVYRVQQNTVEQLVVFLPALWMFGTLGSAPAAAGIGAVFILGRAIYLVTYVADPAKRTVGFGLGFLANLALVIGSLVQGIRALL
jgi:uncharacterized MAPEG superfamily protein